MGARLFSTRSRVPQDEGAGRRERRSRLGVSGTYPPTPSRAREGEIFYFLSKGKGCCGSPSPCILIPGILRLRRGEDEPRSPAPRRMRVRGEGSGAGAPFSLL